MRTVELHQLIEVDIRNAVSVGHEKRRITQPRLESFDATAGQGIVSRFNQMYRPVLTLDLMALHFSALQVDCQAAAEIEVVDEEPFDRVAFVTESDEELFEAKLGKVFHDVPKDRPSADLDHWFGFELGFLGKTRTQTASEDHDLHDCPPVTGSTSNKHREICRGAGVLTTRSLLCMCGVRQVRIRRTLTGHHRLREADHLVLKKRFKHSRADGVADHRLLTSLHLLFRERDPPRLS